MEIDKHMAHVYTLWMELVWFKTNATYGFEFYIMKLIKWYLNLTISYCDNVSEVVACNDVSRITQLMAVMWSVTTVYPVAKLLLYKYHKKSSPVQSIPLSGIKVVRWNLRLFVNIFLEMKVITPD